MPALGSPLGHKIASKICNMTLPKPKMHPIAFQHGLSSTKSDPMMAPETRGIACLSPKMASELLLHGKPFNQTTSTNQWKINMCS